METELSPTQQRLLHQLRREPEPLVFEPEFVDHLLARALEVVTEASERLAGLQVFVSKGFLAKVHGCEVRHLAPDDFRWTAASLAGTVAHRAIQLALNWRGEPVPGVVVDEAIALIEQEANAKADAVVSIGDAERALLRSGAVDRVTRFLQDFPPIPMTAQPVLESNARWQPPGSITLQGRADFVFGKVRGNESTRVIVDLKSGRRHGQHREDLRFYALLETLHRRVPPRKLVTYYLDECEAEIEDVTEGVLESALARVEGALRRHAELVVDGREPEHRPSGVCRWCPVADGCEPGRAHLRALADRDGLDGDGNGDGDGDG